MTTVSKHPASATVHRAFTDIVGTVPVPDVPMDALRRPRPGNLPLDPASGVAKWLAGRAPILATGPRGTNERTDSGVAKELAPVNQQFWLAANGRIDAARAGLDQRGGGPPAGARVGRGGGGDAGAAASHAAGGHRAPGAG